MEKQSNSVEPDVLPTDEPENSSKNEQDTASEKIDKLTAIEMLQLLKEYKKREFLYIAELSSLQKELFMLQNGEQTCTNRSSKLLVTPFYPILEQCQVALYDPAVNLEIKTLRSKLYEQTLELRKTQDELKAATYSSESVMGRRLINKCKALQEENTDIGKMLLENQLQPLQIQTNVLSKQLAFFKQQLKILHELNADLDDENERLTRQVQELTVLYKTAIQERDAANVKLEKLNQKKSTSGKEKQNNSYRRSSSQESYRHKKVGEDSTRRNTKSEQRKDTSRRSDRRTSRRDIDFNKRNDKRKNSDTSLMM